MHCTLTNWQLRALTNEFDEAQIRQDETRQVKTYSFGFSHETSSTFREWGRLSLLGVGWRRLVGSLTPWPESGWLSFTMQWTQEEDEGPTVRSKRVRRKERMVEQVGTMEEIRCGRRL